jgi:hypothetical protein
MRKVIKMDYVQQWVTDLTSHASYSPLKAERESWGEINRHVSPRTMRAKVKIAIAPSPELEIVDRLSSEISRQIKDAECFDPIVYGVLDVMMTALSSPVRTFRLSILDAVYDDIHSSPMAFRLAAREAAKAILSEGKS